MGALDSAERVVGIGPRIIRERNAAIQLHAFEAGKDEHCLHEIHPDLAVAGNRPILKGDLIGLPLRVKFDPASKYMIRAINRNGSADNELAVVSDCFPHDESFRAGFDNRTIGPLPGVPQ